jgi:predicted permease
MEIGGIVKCFNTLGLRTEVGRPFSVADDIPNGPHLAVLTYHFWQSAFHRAQDVVGQNIRVEETSFTIIGVADREFTGLQLGSEPSLIVPLSQTPGSIAISPARPLSYWIYILARRVAGVSDGRVQSYLNATAKRLLEESVPLHDSPPQRADYIRRRLHSAPGSAGVNWWYEERFSTPLYIVLGICGCVLLLACVNLSAVVLTRILRRNAEFELRQALGANRFSVALLLILENSIIVVIGAIGGLLFARTAQSAVAAAVETLFGTALKIVFDSRLIVLTVVIVIFVILLFACVSVGYSLRLFSALSITRTGRSVIGYNARGQKLLLAVQLALTLLLVNCAAVLGRSFDKVNSIDLGIRTDGVYQATLAPTNARDANRDSPRAYYDELLSALADLPIVRAAALSNCAPLWTGESVETVKATDAKQNVSDLRAQVVLVSESFFSVLGIPILSGEPFHRTASDSKEPTTIVSASLAALIGEGRVLGRHIEIGDEGHTEEVKIVGVARNARLSLEHPNSDSQLIIYLNVWQQLDSLRTPVLLMSTAHGAVLPVSEVEQTVAARGRHYVEGYTSLMGAKDEALIENRVLAFLSRAFAAFTLVLAATGVFGILSYYVAGRTREIGVRIALGGTPSGIRNLIFHQVSPLVLFGSLVGIGLTFAAGRFIASMLFGITAYDPLSLAMCLLILLLTVALAAWIPARRATLVDPLVALRQE